VTFFRHAPLHDAALCRAQKPNPGQLSVHLIRDTQTRWNSTLFMFRRTLEMLPAIDRLVHGSYTLCTHFFSQVKRIQTGKETALPGLNELLLTQDMRTLLMQAIMVSCMQFFCIH